MLELIIDSQLLMIFLLEKINPLLYSHLTGVLLASYRKWEKIPILEARAIGYRTGPKTGIFSPSR